MNCVAGVLFYHIKQKTKTVMLLYPDSANVSSVLCVLVNAIHAF